ncbi:hypothetical protein BBO99_00009096 [Phytophthora kernoviae]|uniref:Damage-control phosphatase ARMT1 n=1 Tax=Phytophthora kernoviae TaxID=325452 RepID=A0A3R7KPK5_9STRA|nr:hypothetical protein JM16_008936 [Phytophthora kernoviae]KAG2525472.1 hypothetical protein JM18_003562 [Phytophthora kernoviae]RLN02895.1 hypothetical protein BBI17_009049 [Phytophthora kernoviae]RLN74108.1 hypothetical protein BBO99_00009096 [Phytophthora kernoviae]
MGVSAEFLARVQQGEEIFTNVPGTFANESYKTRLPGLVRDVVTNNRSRFSAKQCERLLNLVADMINDAVIPMPSQYPEQAAKSPTSAQWEELLAGKGYTWQNSPWFLGEQYMFHLVLLIAEYYTTCIDPFHPSKVLELAEVTPWALLQTAVGMSAQEEASSQSHHDQLKRFMKLCLWGNKADGCYKEVKDTISGADASLVFDDELLLVDHSDKVISYLEQKAIKAGDAKKLGVQYINDNCGTELLLDLALADHLLAHNWCGKVTLNVKVEPMYVSDATEADVHEHIAEMQCSTRTPEVQALGKRLAGYVQKEQLVVRPDIFWNRYTYYWEMPMELQTRLANEATLVIIKGDLNYRRLLGDRLWPPSTPVEEAVPYFAAAFVSFRTLKSNPVVGIPKEMVDKLEKEDSKWRYNGKRGTIQSVLTPAPLSDNRDHFSAKQSKRLLELADDLINNAKISLPSQYPEQAAKSPSSAHWEELLAGKDYTWQDSPWFMVEQYIFHLLLLMTDYYDTGIDPFRPSYVDVKAFGKDAELKQESPWLLLQTAVSLVSQKGESPQTHHDQLKRFMKLCLWGNKADGSNQKVMDTMNVTDTSLVFDDELLVVDHSDEIISYLEHKAAETSGPKNLRVEFICDNVGTELLLDLAMTDYLLTHDWCGKVTFNVKAEPLYVSDVMIPDVHEYIAEMQRPTRTPEVQELGKRLAEHVRTQQLVIRADDYWNMYTYYWEMPTELQTRLAKEATLVILKGDLNYRRLLGDRMWPPSTPVLDVMPYFPTAFVAFRILKSGLVVGIPEETVERLEKDDPDWRYNGKRGTIQSVLKAAPQL